jgi:hypothetical protein
MCSLFLLKKQYSILDLLENYIFPQLEEHDIFQYDGTPESGNFVRQSLNAWFDNGWLEQVNILASMFICSLSN